VLVCVPEFVSVGVTVSDRLADILRVSEAELEGVLEIEGVFDTGSGGGARRRLAPDGVGARRRL